MHKMLYSLKAFDKEKKRKKERKTKGEAVSGPSTEAAEEVEEEKPIGRDWTLSIALPGSILDNAQSFELRFVFFLG